MAPFALSISGQILTGTIHTHDHLTVKYEWHYNKSHWTYVCGQTDGISHCCTKSPSPDGISTATWSLPLNLTLSSSNIHGWPRLVLTIYAKDWLGRDVVMGYGSVIVPLKHGPSFIQCPIYRPEATSMLEGLICWASGSLPHFADPLLPAKNDHRDLVRTCSSGFVGIKVNIISKGLLDSGLVF
ncbi:hypothetical protein P9112_012147 [Eukaryota sp. TZLM1-RC]